MKLAAPLRVSWDWNRPPALRGGERGIAASRERTETVARALAEARVLLVEIGYPTPEEVTGGVLAAVAEELGAQVSLIVTPSDLERLPEGAVGNIPAIGELWIDMTPAGEGGETNTDRPDEGPAPEGIRIYLTRRNWRRAARIAAAAVEGGARRLSLPILPLFGSFLQSARELVPPWRDLVEFANLLEPVLRQSRDLDLRVHHQALWALLRERGLNAAVAEAPGHSGCQAGAALAYVDPAGVLYPCAALPIPLARLGEQPVEEVWKSEEKARLREAIEAVPEACSPCAQWESCRGGCRGWAHYLTGDWKDPGPDCGREGHGTERRR